MADDIQMDEPKVGETDGVASAPAEVEVTVGDAAREDDAVEVASIIDTVDGMPSGSDPRGESRVSGEDDVVDEVVDDGDDFGRGRVVQRESSENGHDDEREGRRRKRGRSRSRSRSRARSRSGSKNRSREWQTSANGDNSRDRGRGRNGTDRDRERDRERDSDRSRGRERDRDRDRDAGNGHGANGRDRERGRDDSRGRDHHGDVSRDRDRGREVSRDRDRGRGSSRDREHHGRNDSRDRDRGRDERERLRGRDRESFDNTRERPRQSTHTRRDRGVGLPVDSGRGRGSFRGRGSGPIMHQPPPMGGQMGPMTMPGGMMGMPPAPNLFQHQAPGQMMFTPQRPTVAAPKGGGPAHIYNILPMITFKAFMAEQREDVTPEECKQRYEEYKADYVQRLTHSFIDVHREEEWFQERYHPKLVAQKQQERIAWTATESVTFAEQLRFNPAAFIGTASLEPISQEERWGTLDAKKKKRQRIAAQEIALLEGGTIDEQAERNGEKNEEEEEEYDVDAKEFAQHHDKVVFVRRIPAWMSTEELGRQVKTEGGKYVRIVASDAVNNRNDDFARSAYIVYETSKKATAASQKLNKLRVFHRSKPAGANTKKATQGDKSFEMKTFTYRPRAQTSVEHDFSTASRVAHDTKRSLELARALDVEFGLADRPEGIDALLRESQVEEAIEASLLSTAKVDLVCAYLKRVHFFLYYRGQQCKDEGDMIASRSACRGIAAASKEEVQEAMLLVDSVENEDEIPKQTELGAHERVDANSNMARAPRKPKENVTEVVDAAVTARLTAAANAEAAEKQFASVLERYDECTKTEVDKWLHKSTGRTDEGYARCTMSDCGKLFKAPEFVHKHLVNKHPDKHTEILTEVAYPFVRDMFLADDNKPLPNIAPDANTPPVVMMPGMGMSAPIAPMGGMAPGFPMMGGGLPMGPMGPMGPLPPPPVAPQIPMQLHPPHDSVGGFRGRGLGGFRGRGGGGRFGGRGGGMMGGGGPEPISARDPRSLVSYVDVDAPKDTTPDLDYGNAFPSKSKSKKRKTM